ncbi:hypothetical protein lerEdw1_015256 [Lerista edwardsae]|nr:hypothetical protein lerEdw1_015256 [Lerista edwardsae]
MLGRPVEGGVAGGVAKRNAAGRRRVVRFRAPFERTLIAHCVSPQVPTMAERPEDLNLPNAVVTRIIKEALPDGVNISKEARSAISRAASVFVLYATSCANNFAMKGKRKTLNAGDVLSAMEEMEFQRFLGPLKESLEAYRREQKGKKVASEPKKKDKDKKEDSEEADKSRDEENEEEEERMEEEEEQNEEEEVDN